MATIQILKKKLRSIRSTQKITKAMQTASTAKFSKLNARTANYKNYCREWRTLYEQHLDEYRKILSVRDMTAPEALVVITGNKGMCGGFNSEVLTLARELIEGAEKPFAVYLCGKKAQTYFDEGHIAYEEAFTFGDIPMYAETQELFAKLCRGLRDGKYSTVKVVYSSYTNITKQTPTVQDMFADGEEGPADTSIFFPDESSVVKKTADNIMGAFMFEKILESALGAQAATLMAMRSAHDAATEYSVELEREINRSRQKQVTADVIETSVDCTEEEN